MNLQQLYYFRTLAETQHFTKASMKMSVTQPSLSHAINDLESELGICLFHRSHRQVTLTKYGELFLAYVDRSLAILDEGRIKLNDFISPEQGTVSLYYVSSIDPFLPYLVTRYLQENGGNQTMFQFQQASNIQIHSALHSGEADLGLGMPYEEETGLRSVKLGEHELVLLVCNDHPLAQRESVDLRELQGARFITYKYECIIRGLIDTIFRDLDLRPKIVSETVHDTMIYSSVAANFGVALVPMPLRGQYYNVKALQIENPIPTHDVFLKWKDVKYISPAVEQFRDFILSHDDIFQAYRRSLSQT